MSFFSVSTNNGKMNIKPVATYPLNTDSSLLLYYTFETTNGLSLLNNKTGLYDASLSNTAIVTTANKKNGSQSAYFNTFTGALSSSTTTSTNTFVILPNIIYGYVNGVATGFTVSCWINVTNITNNPATEIWQLGDGANLGLSIYPGGGLQIGGHGINIAYFYVTTNAWNHVVFTCDSLLNTKVYLNNVLFTGGTTSASSYPFTNSTTNLNFLGVYSSGGTINTYAQSTYNGYIDDFRFYNRVLSAAEIASLYTYK